MPSLSCRRLLGVLCFAFLGAGLTLAADRLTSRPRVETATAKDASSTKAGDELSTKAGERRRVVLPDRSVVYLREQTTLRVGKKGSSLELKQGEVFIESTDAVSVQAGKRALSSPTAGRFAVRAGGSLVVASGSVKVDGDATVSAGQQLGEKETKPTPAPRIEHVVAWTRELRNAAPLVPRSEHAGGTLVARTPEGQETQLHLRRFHIDVHIEDGFARTTIDQTFFNHTLDRLEGTFRFPLPPDASLCRLAMYVEGNLMEGGMAERDYARSVYERIVWEKRDPALLEWVDGSTFKLRVFPLEARQEKRLLLSYTQRLPILNGRLSYRFPAGHSFATVDLWGLHVRVKNGAGFTHQSDSHTLTPRKDNGDLILERTEKNAKLDRDVVLHFADDATKPDRDEAKFATMEQDGAKYLLVRYRPALSGSAAGSERRDWVVLMESSGDRDPLLMRTQIELLRSILSHAGRDDTFQIVAASTRTSDRSKTARVNDLVGIEEAMLDLEKVHLIGALDLGKALSEVQPLLKSAKNPHLLHLGSGIAAMGEARVDELTKRLPAGTRYVGVGVGKRWNRPLMQSLADSSAGYFTQVNPDEALDWRALEVISALNAPRLLDASITDAEGTTPFLSFGRHIGQGEELAAVCRVTGKGELPTRVKITGKVDGKSFEQVLEVKDIREKAAYLPRSWAKLEIDRLLAENAAENKKAIVELSKAMYVMTPFTSLLVLENEDMYTQFKVDRGRKDHWAMYPAPGKIEVVVEPLEGVGDPRKGIKPTAKVVSQTVLVRGRPGTLRGHDKSGPRRLWEHYSPTSASAREPERLAADSAPRVDRLTRLSGEMLQNRPERLVEYDQEEAKKVGEVVVTGGSVSAALKARKRILDLTNNDVGIANGTSLEYNSDRIDDVTVPGSLLGRGAAASLPPRVLNGRELEEFAFRRIPVVHSPLPAMGALPLEDGAEASPLGETPATRNAVLYSRINYSHDERLFADLLAQAPGLNTSGADLRAVFDAEARSTGKVQKGTVSPEAERLYLAARKPGWQSVTYPAQGLAPSFKVSFDDKGRFAWTRTLANGLREQVVCDGSTMYHLYPELGLAARREVSRHHRLAFSDAVPQALPGIEDLTNGSDVVRLGSTIVAVVPKGARRGLVEMHLVFDGDRLKERRWVHLPSKTVLRRDRCDDETQFGKVEATTEEPSLKPDLRKLVVLDLPYRSADVVKKQLGIEKKRQDELTFVQLTRLLASYVAANDSSNARNIFTELHRREQRQLGYYVLLASVGLSLDTDDQLDVLGAHPHEPLAAYLALYSSPTLRKRASRWAAASNTWSEGFLKRLAHGHFLCQRWSSSTALGTSKTQKATERQRALEYISKHPGSSLAWALLGLLQDRTAEEKGESDELQPLWAELAKAHEHFLNTSLASQARYEQARCLWRAGQKAEARKRFVALYDEAMKAGHLLPVDWEFRAALVGSEDRENNWSGLMRRTARGLITQDRRAAALVIARQAWQLGDQPLAQQLYELAIDGVEVKGLSGLALYARAIRFLQDTNQTAEADRLVTKLLADEEHAKIPELWRIASRLAGSREMLARQLECLEKALELEYDQKTEVINLEQVRSDYRELLDQYENLAKSLAILKVAKPADFRERVIRAADRWRALDRDQDRACNLAAAVLRRLGERELAWDYLTTPVGINPGESHVWTGLAGTLVRQGERDLADRAYLSAFERESSNAQILWDRADNLRRSGRLAEARKLYKQLAEGDWQPRFASLKEQAKWLVE